MLYQVIRRKYLKIKRLYRNFFTRKNSDLEKSHRSRIEDFRFGSIAFRWGSHISDIKEQLEPDSNFIENENRWATSKTLNFKISSFLSFKANSVEFEAPFLDRIIDRVFINIPPQEKKAQQIIEALEAQYGTPFHKSIYKYVGQNDVAQSCEWKFENCNIYISYFGRTREEYGEHNRARIYIYLKDINLIDSLYGESLKKINQHLEHSVIKESVTKFQTSKRQSTNWDLIMKDYSNMPKNVVLRAMNGYKKNELFKTPSILQAIMTEYHICIWKSMDGAFYISNYFETGELNKEKNIYWHIMTPAKGRGSVHLEVGDFSASDDFHFSFRKDLNMHIENLLNIKIKSYEEPDC